MGCAFVHVFFRCTFVGTCMPVLLLFCAELDLSPGAHGDRISNPAGLLVVPIKASMEVWSFLMCRLVSNFFLSVLKTKTVSVFPMVMILMPATDERSFSTDDFLSGFHQEQEATITATKIRKHLCESRFKKMAKDMQNTCTWSGGANCVVHYCSSVRRDLEIICYQQCCEEALGESSC